MSLKGLSGGSAVRSGTSGGASRIYLPGEIEAEKERASAQRGIDVDAPVCDSLDKLLAKAGLAMRMKDGEVRA